MDMCSGGQAWEPVIPNMPSRHSRGPRQLEWIFTLNNYTQQDADDLLALVPDKLAYVFFGKEVAPTTGTPHLQGFLVAKKRCEKTALLKIPPLEKCYLDAMRADIDKNVEYCHKDGETFEAGIRPKSKQGKRTDLEDIANRLTGGASLREIAVAYPGQFIRYHSGISALASVVRVKTFDGFEGPFRWPYPDQIKSLVICGPADIGKTTFALFLLPKALFISDLDGLLAFDPTIHEGIIFDDMSFTDLSRERQIHILDWDHDREIRIRYKLAMIPRHTKKIFVCNPESYPIFSPDGAILRRFTLMMLE